MTDSIIDLATFTDLQETAGAEFVHDLIDAFEEEAPSLLSAMREARAAGQAKAFERAAHSLKSNANTFGASALAAQARALELGSLAAGDDSALTALEAEYRRALQALKDLRHG
jgi:HPt (histidine-containing phosphotransfer) domain-containing protein